MSVDTATLAQLAPGLTGRLLQPADAEYEDARRVHNGLVDKRPALIARCRGVADICDAVKLARALNLEVAVRGGGHNVAGHATIDGGLMIDLAPMKGIYVDPRAHVARAQGGVLWSEFNRETQGHGLATTGGVVGSTGVAGLTLGGGLGWLMPKYGLALDNLRSAEIVMADASVKHASTAENADLFWAIRGGGGNFGIAASFEYDLHPVGPIIAGGLVAHPHAKAIEVLQFFREQCASAPDELMLVAGLAQRARWIRREAHRHRGRALRVPSRRRGSAPAVQGVRSAGHGCDGPDFLLRPERPLRRGLAQGRAELLEVPVSHRSE